MANIKQYLTRGLSAYTALLQIQIMMAKGRKNISIVQNRPDSNCPDFSRRIPWICLDSILHQTAKIRLTQISSPQMQLPQFRFPQFRLARITLISITQIDATPDFLEPLIEL